jgi:hypothetical protein
MQLLLVQNVKCTHITSHNQNTHHRWILADAENCVKTCPKISSLQYDGVFAVCPSWVSHSLFIYFQSRVNQIYERVLSTYEQYTPLFMLSLSTLQNDMTNITVVDIPVNVRVSNVHRLWLCFREYVP